MPGCIENGAFALNHLYTLHPVLQISRVSKLPSRRLRNRTSGSKSMYSCTSACRATPRAFAMCSRCSRDYACSTDPCKASRTFASAEPPLSAPLASTDGALIELATDGNVTQATWPNHYCKSRPRTRHRASRTSDANMQFKRVPVEMLRNCCSAEYPCARSSAETQISIRRCLLATMPAANAVAAAASADEPSAVNGCIETPVL